MFHTIDGRSLKSGLTVVYLLLTHCSTGQSQVAHHLQPVVAVHRDDVILPCHLEPPVDAVDMTLEWARADLNPRFVHMRRFGEDHLSHQHPSYKGRTSMSTDDLKQGDVSLKLSRVQLSDEGNYKCFIPSAEKESTIQLLVAGSPSSPLIKMRISQNAVVLECRSAGWYPEPEVLWLDAEGNIVSAGPTETLRGPDGLYTVSSSVTVDNKHSNTFTCKLQHNKTNQTRETQIQVPELVQSSSSTHIIIGVGVFIFILCLVAVFFVWKLRRNKTSKSKTENPNKEEDENYSNEESKKLLKDGNVQVNREGSGPQLQKDEENKLTDESHESALPGSVEGGGHREEQQLVTNCDPKQTKGDNKFKSVPNETTGQGLMDGEEYQDQVGAGVDSKQDLGKRGNKSTCEQSLCACSDETEPCQNQPETGIQPADNSVKADEEDNNKQKETRPCVPVEDLQEKTQDAKQNDPNKGGENDMGDKSISNNPQEMKMKTSETQEEEKIKLLNTKTQKEKGNLSEGQKEGDQNHLGEAESRLKGQEEEPGEDREEMEGEKEAKIQADEGIEGKTDAEIQKETEDKNESVNNNQETTLESNHQKQKTERDVSTNEDEEEKLGKQKGRTSASLSFPSSVRGMGPGEPEETNVKGEKEEEKEEESTLL